MPIARPLALLWLILAVTCLTACNRAAMRIPGTGRDFPATATHYSAASTYPYTVSIAIPEDLRPKYYGLPVAGTRWEGCETDPFASGEASSIIRQRLVDEFGASRIFDRVSQEPAKVGDVVVHTEIRAFCSQVIGFFYSRGAGITSLRICIERDGTSLLDETFEKVVTDADKEYTGAQVTFIERAMKVIMADSLRELLRDLLPRVDAAARVLPNNSLQPTSHSSLRSSCAAELTR